MMLVGVVFISDEVAQLPNKTLKWAHRGNMGHSQGHLG